MELRIAPYQPAEAPQFNYAELKAAVEEKMALYAAAIYSDDQIKEAKADKAALNKLRKALNDERIRREREFMEPFNAFKAQVNEIISIIDRPVAAIDAQVKNYEERKKAEKRQQIEAYWNEVLQADKVPAKVCFSHIFDEKWLNASVQMKTIRTSIDNKLAQIVADMDVLRTMSEPFTFEAEEYYLSTLDLTATVRELNRLKDVAARKAAAEAAAEAAAQAATIRNPQRVEPEPADLPTEPKRETVQREWIAFQALLSPEEARALGQYMKSNGIQYKAV